MPKVKVLSYTRETLPRMTEARLKEMQAHSRRPDREINTSEIPAWTKEDFRDAKQGIFYRPRKMQITARVDADVLAWLKAEGRGYQSRLNAILRKEMVAGAAPNAQRNRA